MKNAAIAYAELFMLNEFIKVKRSIDVTENNPTKV